MARCTLCRCDATTEVFGFRVCAYHQTHGEDDAPCPVCHHPADQPDVYYDYDHQAWVVNGRYSVCGHPEKVVNGQPCCFAGAHAGETVRENARRRA